MPGSLRLQSKLEIPVLSFDDKGDYAFIIICLLSHFSNKVSRDA